MNARPSAILIRNFSKKSKGVFNFFSALAISPQLGLRDDQEDFERIRICSMVKKSFPRDFQNEKLLSCQLINEIYEYSELDPKSSPFRERNSLKNFFKLNYRREGQSLVQKETAESTQITLKIIFT